MVTIIHILILNKDGQVIERRTVISIHYNCVTNWWGFGSLLVFAWHLWIYDLTRENVENTKAAQLFYRFAVLQEKNNSMQNCIWILAIKGQTSPL